MHICVERKLGLIHKKAIYSIYCKPLITSWNQASHFCILFCFCITNTYKCSPQSCAEDISAAAWRQFCPSLTPSFSLPLLLHTGWISTLGPPVLLCNGIITNLHWWTSPCISDRELSPPMTELEGAEWAGIWIWNRRGGSSEGITD